MIPNQASRDTWGTSVQGYYCGAPAAANWFNWAAGQSAVSGRSGSGWGPYSNHTSTSHSGGEGKEEGERGNEKSAKLGINSNIYSIYQNRNQSSAGSEPNMNHIPGRIERDMEGGVLGIHPTIQQESGYISCQDKETDLTCLKQESNSGLQSGFLGVLGETLEAQFGSLEDTAASKRTKENQGEGFDPDRRYEQAELTIDEGSCMEPDSSTDLSLEPGSSITTYNQRNLKQSQISISGNSYQGGHQGSSSSGSGTDMRTDPRTDLRADVRADLRTDLRSQLDLEQERAFKQSKQFAQLFKIKPEATDGNFKRRRLDPSEVSEVEYRRIVGGGNLPLSVEIDELENSSESISPHAQRLVAGLLSPRKRGRKPKHYSEILYELGQRGISITKTQRNESPPPPSTRPHLPSPILAPLDPHALNKSGNQSLKCPHCNKVLTTSVGLMYHIRLHTGEKPYTCDLCGKSFATSSHYHYHIRTHSGEKPYRCDFCGKMYTASGSLRLHLKSHLTRLSANVFGGLGLNNLDTFNSLNMFRGLESMLAEKAGGGGGGGLEQTDQGNTDFKFNIKQEIFDGGAERRDVEDGRRGAEDGRRVAEVGRRETEATGGHSRPDDLVLGS